MSQARAFFPSAFVLAGWLSLGSAAFGQCGLGNGDCFSANGTPGCDNAACCEAVCSVDPSCCRFEWDEICANEAFQICGTCQPGCGAINIACLAPGPEFNNRNPVCRLNNIPAGGFCTGWIIAKPNFIITTRSCITTNGEPDGPIGDITSIFAEFGYECDKCLNGTFFFSILFNVDALIHDSSSLDYAILRTEGDPSFLFGVASIDDTTPLVGETVYEIHHADGDFKGYSAGTVTTEIDPALCDRGATAEFGVEIGGGDETRGSPIFRNANHCVIGLAHCGAACEAGFAVPMSAIIPDATRAIIAAGGELTPCDDGPLCPADGNCFKPHDTPGCNNEECCEAVCAVDPFCCIVEWDEFCAIEALNSCTDPACPGEGSCFEANGTPGCAEPICCNTVCQIDPACCEVEWDESCAAQAARLCDAPPPNCPGKGSCFEQNGSPGCENVDCCSVVCELDPVCCSVEWDSICVVEAGDVCAIDCGHPEAGNCFLAGDTAFCQHVGCCEEVCAIDPMCCNAEWDDTCVLIADKLCANPACPGPGDCFKGNNTPGCDDPVCCNTICLLDPFCCDVGWDLLCAFHAGFECPQAACPWDLDDNGNVGTNDLVTLLGAWGSSPDGPPDFDGDGVVGTSDLIALLGAWGPCPP